MGNLGVRELEEVSHLQKEEVWGKVGHTDKAQQILGNELIRALEAPLATHLNDEGSGDREGKSQSAQALKDRHSLQADLTGVFMDPPMCLWHHLYIEKVLRVIRAIAIAGWV